MKKKILFLVTEDWYYWMHRRNLALHLLQNGWEVHLATRKGEYSKRIRGDGVILHFISISRKSLNPFSRFFTVLKIISLYRKIKPLVLHHVSLQSILLGSLAAFFSGNKKILNAFTGLGYLFMGQGKLRRIIRHFFVQFLKHIFRLAKPYSIFENAEDRNILLSYGVVGESSSCVLPGSGVDVVRFSFQEESVGMPVVLLPARMLYDKGVKEFVDSALLLKQKYKDVDFVLAGKLDLGNPTSIHESQIRAWEETGSVRWLGEVKDMPELYHSSHIVCLPSYREGMPMSLAEAASCGRAIVTTDVTGCREIVREGVNGFLVPAKDSLSLANRIEILLLDSGLRKKMGENGRKIVVEEFNQKIVFEKLKSIYEKL